ncbi:MAG: tetratricopeptide repeat protein [Methylacidiphilales bacterium]|nr:tetratricopeptide repeat protein [Candidatus Methylacidiphilales bacterium]NJR19008.1 tetratricopeptide repeat protein [Calothrix sp. CSU_2_0]
MSESGNRWMVRVVLVLSAILFAGVSAIGIINLNNSTPSQANNPDSPSGRNSSNPDDVKAKLEDEVRGYEQVLQKNSDDQTILKGLVKARLNLLALKKSQGKLIADDFKPVIEPLERLVKLNPQDTEQTVLLAQLKESIGDREGAAQNLRAVLETRPGDTKAVQAMVSLMMNQKRPEAAIGLLEETLAKAPQANKIEPNSVDTIDIQVLLGNIHASQKRYGKAFEIYEKASKTDPKDFRPILAKALVLKDQGKIDEAKPLFANATALAPARYKDEINKAAMETPTPVPTATATATP